MTNNKKEGDQKNREEKIEIKEGEAPFLEMDYKETKRSIISNIKKQLVMFPVLPFTTDFLLSYKIAYDFLTSNPNKKIVSISADKPVKKVLEDFKENNFDIADYRDRIIFIDLVSKSVSNSKAEKGTEIIYLENPDNLTELSMVLQDTISDPAIEILFVDSLNGLLAFNEELNIVKFIRFLSAIAEETDTTTILIFYKGEHSLQTEIAFQLPCDGLLQVEDDKIVLKKKTKTIII